MTHMHELSHSHYTPGQMQYHANELTTKEVRCTEDEGKSLQKGSIEQQKQRMDL